MFLYIRIYPLRDISSCVPQRIAGLYKNRGKMDNLGYTRAQKRQILNGQIKVLNENCAPLRIELVAVARDRTQTTGGDTTKTSPH